MAPSNCNAVSCCRVSCSLSSWAAHGAEACSRASGTPVEDLCGSASCKIEPRATWSSQSARSLGLDIARFTWDVLARSDRTYSASRAGPTFIDWWQTRATSTPIGRPPVCTYEPQKCAISANGRLVARFAWEIVSARTGPLRSRYEPLCSLLVARGGSRSVRSTPCDPPRLVRRRCHNQRWQHRQNRLSPNSPADRRS